MKQHTQLLAALLAICMAVTMLPMTAYSVPAENKYAPTGVTAEAVDDYYGFKVNWSVPDNDKTLSGFIVEGGYTHTVKWTDCSGNLRTKTFTLSRNYTAGASSTEGYAAFPSYSVPESAFITVTAYYSDGTSAASEKIYPHRQSDPTPQNHSQYLYMTNTEYTAGTNNGQYSFYTNCSDKDCKHPTYPALIAGNVGDDSYIHYDSDTKTLTMKNYTIDGNLYMNGLDTLTISVIGSCAVTGKIFGGDDNMDVFIVSGNTNGTRAKFNSKIITHGENRGTDFVSYSMAGVDFSADGAAISDGYDAVGALTSAAFAFVDCAVNIKNEDTAAGFGIVTSGYTSWYPSFNTHINSQGLFVEDCDVFNVTATVPIHLNGGGIPQRAAPSRLINSTLRLTTLDKSSRSTSAMTATTLLLENAKLYISNAAGTQANIYGGISNGVPNSQGSPLLSVDENSLIDINFSDVSTRSFAGIDWSEGTDDLFINEGQVKITLKNDDINSCLYGVRGNTCLKEGCKFEIDAANTGSVYGICSGSIIIDNTKATVKVRGSGDSVYGMNEQDILMSGNDSLLDIDVKNTGDENTRSLTYGILASSCEFRDGQVKTHLTCPVCQYCGMYVRYTVPVIDHCDVDVIIDSNEVRPSSTLVNAYGINFASGMTITDSNVNVSITTPNMADGVKYTLTACGINTGALTMLRSTLNSTLSSPQSGPIMLYGMYLSNSAQISDSTLNLSATALSCSSEIGAVCALDHYGGNNSCMNVENSTLNLSAEGNAAGVYGKYGTNYNDSMNFKSGTLTISAKATSADAEAYALYGKNESKYYYLNSPTFGDGIMLREGESADSANVVLDLTDVDNTSNIFASKTYICAAAADHTHNYSAVVTAPTCTAKGYTTYTCSVCHVSYISDYVGLLDHTVVTEPAIPATCTTAGRTEGSYCSVCGKVFARSYIIQPLNHRLAVDLKPATTVDGSLVLTCPVCGILLSSKTIYAIKSAALTTAAYTYNGSVRTPGVIVKDRKGNTLKNGTDYTVSYPTGRKYVGKYAVKITFKENYSGTLTRYFTINPAGSSISKLSAGSKKFTAKWAKCASQISGYQVQYSTSARFSGAKTYTCSYKTLSHTFSKLSAKKKYYVRVRTYKNSGGVNYFSSWSGAKSVTTKK